MADVSFSTYITGLSVDTIGGSEKLPVVDGSTPKYVTPDLLVTYVNTQQAAASVLTPASGDELHGDRSGTTGVFTLNAVSDYAVARAWTEASTVTPATSADTFLIDRSGTKSELGIDTLVSYTLNLTGLTAATPVSTDLFLFGNGSTPKKITLANLETQLWTDFETYVSGLTAVTTTDDTDKFYCIQGGTPKYVTPVELSTYFDIPDGNVIAPASTTATNIPQWSATENTLTDGLAVRTTVRTDGSAVDTALPTEQAVYELLGGITTLDIDGGTDIGAALADADLFIVDDGGAGTNRKCAASRIKTYCQGIKLDALAAPDDSTTLDATTSLHGLMSKADKVKLDAISVTADVTGPVVSTPDYIPQWHATTDKKLTAGLALLTEVRTDGSAVDTALPTEQAVYEVASAITTLDIDGGTDIGAALADADLFIVDDGGAGTNRKCAASRIKTYCQTGVTLNADTDVSANSWVIDEDNMASDLATKIPTQQSVKAYVDSAIAGLTYLQSSDIDTLAEINAILGDATLVTVEATDASGYGWVIDEDDMVSDSASKVPTQQSVKAYVDTSVAAGAWDGDIADINLDGGTDIGTALADADLILVDDGASGTNRKSAMSRVWTYIQSKIAALTDISTWAAVIDEDNMASNLATKVPTQQSVKAYVDAVAGTLNNLSATTDPGATDDSGSGYSVGSVWVNTTSDTGFICADATVSAAVWKNMTASAVGWDGDITDADIAGGTDIGADLADADLFIVDDGAGGTIRKSAMSRVWTYVTGKIQGLTAKSTAADADILTIQDSADSNNLKELTVANLRNQVVKQKTASYATSQTLTSAECYDYIIYVTGAATITLPAVADGMSVAVITIGAVAVSVDPDAADKIWLDGTALDDGDKITNASTAGDMAVLTYYSADGWYASTNGWTDGGA